MKKNLHLGFSLIELSIVVLIISIISASLVNLFGRKNNAEKVVETRQRMERIATALNNYHSNFGAIPQPANLAAGPKATDFSEEGSPRDNFTHADSSGELLWGAVPILNLNLPAEYMFDAWGNKIEYVMGKASGNGPTATSGTLYQQNGHLQLRDFHIALPDVLVDPAASPPTKTPYFRVYLGDGSKGYTKKDSFKLSAGPSPALGAYTYPGGFETYDIKEGQLVTTEGELKLEDEDNIIFPQDSLDIFVTNEGKFSAVTTSNPDPLNPVLIPSSGVGLNVYYFDHEDQLDEVDYTEIGTKGVYKETAGSGLATAVACGGVNLPCRTGYRKISSNISIHDITTGNTLSVRSPLKSEIGRNLRNCETGAVITPADYSATIPDCPAYLLISHGPNGYGAYDINGRQITGTYGINANETENIIKNTADNIFIYSDVAEDSDITSTTYFDDILSYGYINPPKYYISPLFRGD